MQGKKQKPPRAESVASEAVATLKRADRDLGRVINRVGAFHLEVEAMKSPFEALAEAIVYQQLTGKAAATIFGRVKALVGGGRVKATAISATGEKALRAAGLSGAKVAAVKDLAAKALDGTVPTLARLKSMSDADIIERLTTIRGVGQWTVEMFLMFRLGRPDVFPSTDYGVRKGFQIAFGTRDLPSPKEMLARSVRWHPYRSVASWYLWRVLDLPRE